MDKLISRNFKHYNIIFLNDNKYLLNMLRKGFLIKIFLIILLLFYNFLIYNNSTLVCIKFEDHLVTFLIIFLYQLLLFKNLENQNNLMLCSLKKLYYLDLFV